MEEEEEEERRRRRRRSGEIRGGWRRGDPSVMEVRVFPPADSMTFQEIYMCDNILIENKKISKENKYSTLKDITVYFLRSRHVNNLKKNVQQLIPEQPYSCQLTL